MSELLMAAAIILVYFFIGWTLGVSHQVLNIKEDIKKGRDINESKECSLNKEPTAYWIFAWPIFLVILTGVYFFEGEEKARTAIINKIFKEKQ